MALIKLEAMTAEKTDGGFSVSLSLMGQAPPFPPRTVEVRSMADCRAALAAYMAEAGATGQKLVVTMGLKSGRAPNGFNQATAGHRYANPVNL